LLGDQDWGNNMIGVHFHHLGTKEEEEEEAPFSCLFVCWLCPVVIKEGVDLHNNDTLNPLYNHTLGDHFFFFCNTTKL
jgi:hypothetical protein